MAGTPCQKSRGHSGSKWLAIEIVHLHAGTSLLHFRLQVNAQAVCQPVEMIEVANDLRGRNDLLVTPAMVAESLHILASAFRGRQSEFFGPFAKGQVLCIQT